MTTTDENIERLIILLRSDRTEIFQQDFEIDAQPALNNNTVTKPSTIPTPRELESIVKVWSDFSTSNLNPDKNTFELGDFIIDDHYDNQEGLVEPFTEIEKLYKPLKVFYCRFLR